MTTNRKHFVTKPCSKRREGGTKTGRKINENGAFLVVKARFDSDSVILSKAKNLIIRQFQFCVFSDETVSRPKRSDSQAITACLIGLYTLPRRAKHAGALAFATASIGLNDVPHQSR